MTRDGADDFGAFLAAVQERYVDLLLMEEFHVSPAFATWFAAEAGVSGARFDGAWHSVTDADGETDLLLRVHDGEDRVGVLIENKIAAPQQQRQAERYHLRAARAQLAGRFGRYVVVLAAPATYLHGIAADISYDATVAYEAIADWFASAGSDARHRWRAALMREVIAQGRRGYTMVVNEAVTRFHRDCWDHLQHHEPLLTTRQPTAKGSGSSWIRFKGRGWGPGREFAVKLDQQIIELGFYRRQVDELRAAPVTWPGDAVLSQKGQTAAVHLSTPPLDKTRPLADQTAALAAALAAAHRLLPFADALRPRADAIGPDAA